MAPGFFTLEAVAEDGGEGPPLRGPSGSRSLAVAREELEVAEIGRLRTVLDVVRSDVCRLEDAVAECRIDNSRTLAEVLRRQEDLIQNGALLDHATMRDPLQMTNLQKFVLDKVEQERRDRAEELSEVRRWAVELVHSCMQPPSISGVGTPRSMGSRGSMQPPSSDGMGPRSSTRKAGLTRENTAESTTCSASDISNDVRFGVAAMKVQLSELQDEFARSQERLSTLASRVTALELGEGGREATLEDEDAIAELLSRTRDCMGQLAKAVPPSAVSGSDRLFHAVTAMRELREENAGLREENLKLGAVVGQSTPRHSSPQVVANAPPVPPLPMGALAAGTATVPATPRARGEVVTIRSMSPPRGQRRLSSVADSPTARAAGSVASAQAATPLPHGCPLPADAAKAAAAAGYATPAFGGAVPPSAGRAHPSTPH